MKRRTNQMWPFTAMTYETAVSASNFANAALLCSLVVGLIATFVIAQTSSIKEERWDNDRQESALKIADLNRLSEADRLARVQLEERIQPRTLSQEQREAIQQVLEKAPRGEVYLNPDWMNPEARIFADHIEAALRSSGFNPTKLEGGNAPISYGIMGAFLVILDGNKQPPHLKPLFEAFKAAGYDFRVFEDTYVPEGAVLIGISAKM